MSQRHRRSHSHRHTQTEDAILSQNNCSSPKIGSTGSPRLRHLSSPKLAKPRPRLGSSDSPKLSRSESPKLGLKDEVYCAIAEEEVFEDSNSLYDKLSKAEEVLNFV